MFSHAKITTKRVMDDGASESVRAPIQVDPDQALLIVVANGVIKQFALSAETALAVPDKVQVADDPQEP